MLMLIDILPTVILRCGHLPPVPRALASLAAGVGSDAGAGGEFVPLSPSKEGVAREAQPAAFLLASFLLSAQKKSAYRAAD